MRDIGNIEKRIDEIEEMTALNMLELETHSLDVFDSAGNNRLKAGITADNFANHYQSDTKLSEYRASIDPARNELRPEFVARPIELVYDNSASSNAVLKGDKVMLSYTETTYRTQPNASRIAIVNPFGTERQTGTIVMSPASDNWSDTNTAVRITKGDTSFDVGAGKSFGDWDFNWSGITDDQLDNFKTGDIVGERVVDGGSYKRRVATGMQQVGPGNDYAMQYETKQYNKRTYQNYNISGISTVRETIGTVVKNITNIPHMRSRFISFRATGLRPNTQYFGFFNKLNISAFMNTSEGTGGFVRWGALARTSPYLEVDNLYGGISTYPSGLGSATAKMLTDANGAISGYFLLPNTTGVTKTSGGPLRFKAGRQIFTLLDISAYNKNNATSIAEFIYESNGVIKDIEENVRETRIVQIGSASASRDGEIVRNNQVQPDGPDQEPDANSGGCFIKGTMIEMADGSEKEISSVAVGDSTRGGIVSCVMKFAPEKIWNYKGVEVSGSHYVSENGQLVRVANSRYGILTSKVEIVYNLMTSGYRIFIKGIEFGAYYGNADEDGSEIIYDLMTNKYIVYVKGKEFAAYSGEEKLNKKLKSSTTADVYM